jgi:DUF2911 family protein
MTRILFFSTALLLGARLAAAQEGIPFSQHGSVTQRVGLTDIRIEYNRPGARGRGLFGKLVPWGRVWLWTIPDTTSRSASASHPSGLHAIGSERLLGAPLETLKLPRLHDPSGRLD